MMKKNFFALLFVPLFAVLSLVACGSDEASSAEEDEIDEYVRTSDDLDSIECTSQKEGMIVYLSEDNKRMVCYGEKWISYFTWKTEVERTKKARSAKDTVANYADLTTCSSTRDEYMVHVKAMKMDLICDGRTGKWVEYALQTLPDTVRSMSALPACLPSVVGAIVYLSSMGEKVICSDGNWTEYKLWLKSSSSTTSSSSRYSSSSYSSSSMSILDAVFGKCTEKRDNEIVFDTNGVVDYYNASDYGYYYCDGDYERWYEPTTAMIDTIGLGTAGDGDFREGRFSYDSWSDYYDDLGPVCLYRESALKLYVYDGGWRSAQEQEVCMLYACTKAREGESHKFKGYTFICADGKWTQDSISVTKKTNWSNPAVTYGTLKDTRDNQTYKTVVIGGKTWMAQNLNYADSASMPNLQFGTSCGVGSDSACAIGGRQYKWAAAMNFVSSYNSTSVSADTLAKSRQGACPTGWHVPDSTEWAALYEAAGKSTLPLKATDIWPFSFYSSYTFGAPTNSLGFDALPIGEKQSSSYYDRNLATYFCSASQYSSSSAYAFVFTRALDSWSVKSYSKTYFCSLRCVQDEI